MHPPTPRSQWHSPGANFYEPNKHRVLPAGHCLGKKQEPLLDKLVALCLVAKPPGAKLKELAKALGNVVGASAAGNTAVPIT